MMLAGRLAPLFVLWWMASRDDGIDEGDAGRGRVTPVLSNRTPAEHDDVMRCAMLLSLLLTCHRRHVRRPSADTIRVGVAVSLKEAITEIARGYEAKTGDKVEFTFGSSGQIMAQIKGGARDRRVHLRGRQAGGRAGRARGWSTPDSRRVVAGNTLVLIVPRDSKAPIDSFESLGKAPVKRLAIGEPKTVPAGQYAMQVLEKLKLDDALAGKLVYGSNVRQVLDYVDARRGDGRRRLRDRREAGGRQGEGRRDRAEGLARADRLPGRAS